MMNRVKHLRTVRQKQNTQVLHDEQSQTSQDSKGDRTQRCFMMNRVKHLRTVRQKQNTQVLHDEQSQTSQDSKAETEHRGAS